jgi:hypothetical protein
MIIHVLAYKIISSAWWYRYRQISKNLRPAGELASLSTARRAFAAALLGA